jgi:hypothetical protein
MCVATSIREHAVERVAIDPRRADGHHWAGSVVVGHIIPAGSGLQESFSAIEPAADDERAGFDGVRGRT